MKFPLAASPFPPIQLSPPQCEDYGQLAASLLQETVDEYDRFVFIQQRQLSKTKWKAVKTRESLTVYKQRGNSTTPEPSEASSLGSVTSTSLPKSQNASWSLPKMLAVGTIAGTLDDVIYGIISPDIEAIKIKTTYVHDELIDGRVLYQIQYPTEEDPFKFLALKWFVKAHPASVSAVVWPRDIVFIEGTGMLSLANGEKLGYHLLQSVELPQCPELSHLGIMRCQFSSCFLFKQEANGTVEVYMKSHVEPGGTIPDIVAVMSTANGLIGCWKSVWCAQNKKLSWMMKEAAAARARRNQFEDMPVRVAVRTGADGRSCCALCEKKFPAFRSIISCELCQTVICPRCRTARKLSYVRRTGEVKIVATVFCKSCITHSSLLSSTDVARAEYVTGTYYSERRTRRASQELSESVAGQSHRRLKSLEPASVPPVMLLDDDLEINDVAVETVEEWEQHQQSSFDEAQRLEGEPASKLTPDTAMGEPSAMRANADEYHNQLWERMARLRLTAEETYQLTKQHTKAIAPKKP